MPKKRPFKNAEKFLIPRGGGNRAKVDDETILAIVRQSPGITARRIASDVGMKVPPMNTRLHTMRRLGLLVEEIVPGPRGNGKLKARGTRIYFTPRGK